MIKLRDTRDKQNKQTVSISKSKAKSKAPVSLGGLCFLYDPCDSALQISLLKWILHV